MYYSQGELPRRTRNYSLQACREELEQRAVNRNTAPINNVRQQLTGLSLVLHLNKCIQLQKTLLLVEGEKDRSDDPLHHERTLLPRSYISVPDRIAPINKYKQQLTCLMSCSAFKQMYTVTENSIISGRREGNVLFNKKLILFTVTWCQTYGKRPLR